VTGDVAIGGGNGSLLKSVINGRVFIDGSATPDVHSDFTATGGISSGQNLSADEANVLALSAQLAGIAPTQTFGDITGDFTITRTAQLNVIKVNLVNLTKKTLTLSGNSTDTFIINVTSPTANFVLNNSKILLTGGLTANHVTVNFPGTGGSLSIYKASTVPVVNGTILAPQRDIVIDNPPVLGSVIGSTIDIHSGAKATGIQCQ
jgi:choice-of-anchor A domain-containing protein